MTPKERVIAALQFREPDRIPWGEHSIDYNVYEMILGRKSLVHAKFNERKAYWEGRRDEVVAHYKRDIPDLVKALEFDLIMAPMVPEKGHHPAPMTKIDEENYRDANGSLYTISSVTGDLMANPINTAFIKRNISEEEVQEMIDREKARPEPKFDPESSHYEVINHLVKEFSKTHFIIAPVNGLEWARFGATEEESWINLLLYPEVCAKIAEYQMINSFRTLKILKALGMDGILSVGDLGNTTNLFASPDIYREIIYPWHVKLYKEAKKLGLYVLRHCCGHVWPVINELAETNDAYEGIQARAGMDIKLLKERVG
ncbi:MAG TPA: hypothetical protein DD727_07760, partial [Clostridiales bacterium]|nr:hypothetical protein [Clostridiales bacterium]